MALSTTSNNVSGLLPDDYGRLIVRPLQRASVALEVTTAVKTDAHEWRAPVVTDDATANWYSENDDMSGNDPVFAEVTAIPRKIGSVIKISSELAEDSSPEAGEQVGLSIARGIAKKLDLTFFGDLTQKDGDPPVQVPGDPTPKGLETIAESALTLIDTMTSDWIVLDPFADAIADVEDEGGTIDHFVAHPTDFKKLLKLKRESGSNEPLLGADPTRPTRRMIYGVPLHSSPGVTPGTIWGIDSNFTYTIVRSDITLERSTERYFENDQVAVKARMRGDFVFTHPKSLAKIKLSAGGS